MVSPQVEVKENMIVLKGLGDADAIFVIARDLGFGFGLVVTGSMHSALQLELTSLPNQSLRISVRTTSGNMPPFYASQYRMIIPSLYNSELST